MIYRVAVLLAYLSFEDATVCLFKVEIRSIRALNYDIFSQIGYFEQYMEYDPFFTQPEFMNPWISDSPEMWEQEKLACV